jgi:D-3-phosphoglycerate dehydrogenase/(S)-sulfolactate dehydrogenase
VSKIAITDPIFFKVPHWNTGDDWFGSQHELIWPETYTIEAMLPLLPEAEAFVTCFDPVTAEMMDAAPNLKVIAKPGAGYNNIDVQAANERGVMVCNAEGVRGPAVAEHAVLHMLYLARNGWLMDDPAWETTPMIELRGKTIGIVGFGDIGRHLARIAYGFGMKVLVNTRTPDPSRLPEVQVAFHSFHDLLPMADFLVMCVPLTSETRGMICTETIELMKESAILVNVARGEVVVTDDLVRAMKTGRLGGAGLDVTDPEPLPNNHELRQIHNVLVSPHHASRTLETDQAALRRTADNILNGLSGKKPINLVNPEVLVSQPR